MCPLAGFKDWMLRYLRSVSHDSLALEQRLVEFISNFTFRVSLVLILNFPNGKLKSDPTHTPSLMVKKTKLARFFVFLFRSGVGKRGFTVWLCSFQYWRCIQVSFCSLVSHWSCLMNVACFWNDLEISPPTILPYRLLAQPSICLLRRSLIGLLLDRPLWFLTSHLSRNHNSIIKYCYKLYFIHTKERPSLTYTTG